MRQKIQDNRHNILLEYNRKLELSKKDPVVLLSPRSYCEMIQSRPLLQEKDMVNIMTKNINTQLTPQQHEVIMNAIGRANLDSVKYWE